MARPKKRARGADGEHFARIPESVLESEACRTLSHAAFKVLVCMACAYRGCNNGTMAMTPLFAEKFGLKGKNTIYRALRELEERGLLVKTREGWRDKSHFALYALGWADIDSRDGEPLPTPERRDNTRWLNWQPSVEERERAEQRAHRARTNAGQKKNLRTHGGEQSVPTVGNGRAECVPVLARKSAVSVPMVGNTSRVSPRGTDETSSGSTADA